MPTEPVPQLRVPISNKTRQALKRIALEKEISIAQLTRDALQAYLSQQGIDIDVSEGLESWGGAGRLNREDG